MKDALVEYIQSEDMVEKTSLLLSRLLIGAVFLPGKRLTRIYSILIESIISIVSQHQPQHQPQGEGVVKSIRILDSACTEALVELQRRRIGSHYDLHQVYGLIKQTIYIQNGIVTDMGTPSLATALSKYKLSV